MRSILSPLRRDYLITALVMLVAAVYVALKVPLESFGAIDLLQYWGGAALLNTDGNPYDVEALTQLERMAYDGDHIPVLLWNPPVVFPVIALFSTVEFLTLQKLWLCFGVLIMLAALELCITAWRGKSMNFVERATLLLLLLSFYPFYLSLSYGQITPVLLLGLALFLTLSSINNQLATWLSGVFLSLTLIKPHLLHLLYLYLILRMIRRQEVVVLGGLIIGGLVLLGLAFLRQPMIVEWYLTAFGSPPILWRTPTLGSLLQEVSGVHQAAVRFLPTLLVAPLAILLLWKSAGRERRVGVELTLIPLSLLTAPYGWVYDQMLIAPLLIWLTIAVSEYRAQLGIARFIPQILVLLNLVMICTPPEWGQQWYLWYPATIGAIAIYFRREFGRLPVHK